MGHLLFIVVTFGLVHWLRVTDDPPGNFAVYSFVCFMGFCVVYFFVGCWLLIYSGAVQAAIDFEKDVAAERRRQGYHG
ncbi:MAG: hypothetical protein V3T65_00655 [Acidobacteriota bacterium]